MAALQQVIAALYVDSGLNADGQRDHPPRARYECLLCHTREGPVTGSKAVAEFARDILTSHRAACPANTQGATPCLPPSPPATPAAAPVATTPSSPATRPDTSTTRCAARPAPKTPTTEPLPITPDEQGAHA